MEMRYQCSRIVGALKSQRKLQTETKSGVIKSFYGPVK